MALLGTETAEAVIGHDAGRSEMLELRTIGTCLPRESHQGLCPLEITIVIGSYIGDEVRRLIRTDQNISQREFGHMEHPSDAAPSAARADFDHPSVAYTH